MEDVLEGLLEHPDEVRLELVEVDGQERENRLLAARLAAVHRGE